MPLSVRIFILSHYISLDFCFTVRYDDRQYRSGVFQSHPGYIMDVLFLTPPMSDKADKRQSP